MRISRRYVAFLLFLTVFRGGAFPPGTPSGSLFSEVASTVLAAEENPFPGRVPAPSLDGGTEWLNTSGPIELRDLRGKIVLLDFWTFCCINCIHILPDLKYLEEKYSKELVVIGVHSAKFDNEKDSENIRQAIMRYEIAHPVINDSDMIIARKYGFSSWPTLVVIDPEGNVVGSQSGEGHRELMDRVIGQMAAFHRSKGTLDERPVRFSLEREKAVPTPLRYPGKLLADAAGNRLFISDSNHNRIVVSSLDGRLIDVIGTGEIGHKDGAFGEATFDHPQGMALLDEKLYVADTENHLLRVVDLKEKQVSTLAGTGSQGRYNARGGRLKSAALNSPWALLIADNVLYVAMAGPHQIWKHDLKSNTIEPYAGSGREDILDGQRMEAALAQPSDLATDGKHLFIVDSEGSAVRRIDRSSRGGVHTLVGAHDLPNGASLFQFGDRDGTGDQARLQHPIGLTWHENRLYVADTYNDKIKQIDPESRECITWLGSERGSTLDPVQLNEPSGLTIADGRMWIADTNNHRLVEVDMATRTGKEFVVDGLQPPSPPSRTVEDNYQGPPVAHRRPLSIKADRPLAVRVEFALPPEHQLNELAPVSYKLAAQDGAGVISSEALNKSLRAVANGNTAEFEIPLSGQTGSCRLTITVSYQYCRHGTGGVCRMGQQRWDVPLNVGAEGVDRLDLSATIQ